MLSATPKSGRQGVSQLQSTLNGSILQLFASFFLNKLFRGLLICEFSS